MSQISAEAHADHKAEKAEPKWSWQTRSAGDAWAERNAFWLEKGGSHPSGASRERRKEPLILCGHGVSLRVDKGRLIVRDGLTHYPQERRVLEFFKGDIALPSRIVMMDGNGSISFDVMAWLSAQNVPLVLLDWQGEVVMAIGGSGFAFDRERVEWQANTRQDAVRRVEFSSELIARKLDSSLTTLRSVLPASRTRDVAEARAAAGAHKLRSGALTTVDQIRMLEAAAAAAYFAAWRGFPITWSRRSQYPVQDKWLTVQMRGSQRKRLIPGNRHATHPVNAMLNYAYAVLRSHVHSEAAAQGFDVRQGIMHHDRDDTQALVYDLMEPLRPKIDAALLKFIGGTKFTGADFTLRDDGVVRVAPQLARRVCLVTARSIDFRGTDPFSLEQFFSNSLA